MRLFPMNFGQARVRLVHGGAALAAATLIAGCGSTYRPVVTPITPSGPEAQPPSFAVVVSAPSTTTAGVVTIVDYAGDSVQATATIGVGPETLTIDELGGTGYTLNSDGTLSNFPISNSLQAKQVEYSTLPSTANPVNLFSPSSGLYAADLNGNAADYFSGFPQAFKLAVPVDATPVMIIGAPVVTQRVFAIQQNIPGATGVECNNSPTTVGVNGLADGIEFSSFTRSSSINLDPTAASGTTNAQCPVYALESADGKRLFVLNRGSDTVSVINTQDNILDACTPFLNENGQTVNCHPILPLSTTAVTKTGVTPPNGTSGMTATAGPVYAEYNQVTQQLVIANYDGNSITVIDVSEDEYGNDSQTFGTTYTIPVGKNPASVTVLSDGSRAYTANQTDQTVSIVQLSSHTVERTVPVTGHPRTVASTQNSQEGKVYAAAPDSPYLSIIRTDLDILDTTVLVQGNIVDMRVSTQTGASGNVNVTTRRPGYGQPCFLPGATTSLAACRTLP